MKPRSDSKLKNLPPERQAAIAARLGAGGPDSSLQAVCNWLREDGVETSTGALSQFYSWWQLRRQCEQNEAAVEGLLESVKELGITATSEQLQALGQAFFTKKAIEQQDSKQWFNAQRLALKKEELLIDRQKFQRETCQLFLEWAEDQRARDIAAGAASNSEKIAKLGELMFGEDWAPKP
ncbi:MAG TPA: hypothetical protein VHB20_14615 [Verrucomicrobiae bacterium]|jgi:hypothetical protein|nr:hypothetical protein [Verrucomicrobiae bacterium]